jgi:hypothetical protein
MLNERKFTALNENDFLIKRKKIDFYIRLILFLSLLLSAQLTTFAQQQNAIPVTNNAEINKPDTLPKTDTLPAVQTTPTKSDALADTSFPKTTISISGNITDETGAPIGGATIEIKGKGKGTSSHRDGQFSIDATSDDILIISFVGYNNKVVHVAGRNNINISLQASKKE